MYKIDRYQTTISQKGLINFHRKSIAKHVVYTIFHDPTIHSGLVINISDLMMTIKWSSDMLTIIKKETAKLKTHYLKYCIKGTLENKCNLWHTFDRIYMTTLIYAQCFQINLHYDDSYPRSLAKIQSRSDDMSKVCICIGDGGRILCFRYWWWPIVGCC